MQLSIDPRALQPDLLKQSLERLVPTEDHREGILESEPLTLPSANREGPVFERWARSVDWAEVDIVVALGLGTGLLVDLVRARSEARLLVLEPRPGVVRSVLSTRPLAEYPDVTIFDNVYRLRSRLRSICSFGVRVMLFAPSWAREELAEHLPALEDTLRDAHMLTLINENTGRANHREWNDLILDGLERFVGRVPINRIADALQGVPGVVVAAGPALDKNIELLRQLQGRAVICALNSSLKALDAKGIRPDLLVTVESKDTVNMVAPSPSVPELILAPGLHAHAGLFELPFLSIMPAIIGSNGLSHWLAGLAEVATLPIGGSVACLGFSVLEHLGCDPIILVGQNCALEGERMYAQGTPLEADRWELRGETARLTSNEAYLKLVARPGETVNPSPGNALNHFKVPGWGGGEVYTIPPLNTYKMWFEEAAQILAGQRRLINATEGGAHIEGFEELRLRQVVDELPIDAVDVASLLRRAESAAAPLDALVVAAALREESENSLKARDLALQAERSANRALAQLKKKHPNGKALRQELARLEGLEEELRATTPQAQLLDGYVAIAVEDIRRKAVREKADSAEQSTRQSLGHSVAIFEAIAAMAEMLAPRLEELAARIEQQGRN